MIEETPLVVPKCIKDPLAECFSPGLKILRNGSVPVESGDFSNSSSIPVHFGIEARSVAKAAAIRIVGLEGGDRLLHGIVMGRDEEEIKLWLITIHPTFKVLDESRLL
jgi:hypothetical protein